MIIGVGLDVLTDRGRGRASRRRTHPRCRDPAPDGLRRQRHPRGSRRRQRDSRPRPAQPHPQRRVTRRRHRPRRRLHLPRLPTTPVLVRMPSPEALASRRQNLPRKPRSALRAPPSPVPRRRLATHRRQRPPAHPLVPPTQRRQRPRRRTTPPHPTPIPHIGRDVLIMPSLCLRIHAPLLTLASGVV